MAGTLIGGLKAKEKNLANDPHYYSKLGSKGGSVSHPATRVFAANRKLARIAGAKGGRISRKPTKVGVYRVTIVEPAPKKSWFTKIKEVFNHG